MLEVKIRRNSETTFAQETAGDAPAFLALYDDYFSRIYTYFRYRFDDPATCDDLASQTFIQALENFAQFSPQRGPVAAWLFGIARNLANRHLQKRRRFGCLPLEALGSLSSSDSSPEERVISRDDRQQVLQAMRALSARQRDLLALKFSARLTNRQIAALTGLTEQNVGVIIHRAVRQLRKQMEGDASHA